MNEQELLALLQQNISYQLRWKHYDRTVEVGSDCHMVTTGKNQEGQITRYRRFEKDSLKKQRIRLNNPITPIYISEPGKMFDKMTRVDGVRRSLEVDNDVNKVALQDTLWNFMPGVDIETWLVGKISYLQKNDPNAWILFDRTDKRTPSGEIEQTNLRAVVFRSCDVLNFENDAGGIPLWVLFRDFRFEYKIEGGMRKDVRLETFYLYDREQVVKAREAGEQTEIMSGEIAIDIEVYPTYTEPYRTAMDALNDYSDARPPFQYTEKKIKTFYVSTIQHGAGEVPAFNVGAYPDEETDQQSFVSWFWPGMPVLLDVIRDKQMLDVAVVMQAFRRRSEFSPVCDFETENHETCEKGWIHTETEGRIKCPSCNGSGLRANFTTEQEVLKMALPPGVEPNQLLELSKLAFEEEIDTTLLEWFDTQLEKHRVKFNNAIFSAGLFQKPTGTQVAQTATETNEKADTAADILRPFGLVVSQGYELAFRVLAAYREYGAIKVNHSYPEQIDLLTLSEEIANFAAIQDVDIYEAKVHQRHRILAKQFEGEPETHQRIAARYTWLPFDDKSPEQLAQILAALSPTDYNAILWAYWKQIFQEIEVETPNFHTLKYEQQKVVVDKKVAEFRGRIELAGGETGGENGQLPEGETPDGEGQSTMPTVKTGEQFAGVRFVVSVSGEPVDLTGATITATFTGHQTFTMTTGGGISIINPAAGAFQIDPQTVTAQPGQYDFVINFKFPDGSNKDYISGTWQIT